MPGPVVVFLGPTLERESAAKHLEAEYWPPAEQGSIVKAVQALDPRAIAIIDGAFAKVPAVRHKEILWALSLGIPVHGAASMGALRAAELAPFGMRGHGLVYRWYRATPLADDDEVAVAMAPPELGACALSDALINMRLTLRRAERRGIIRREIRRALEDLAASIHFVDRSYAHLFTQAKANFSAECAPSIDAAERFAAEHAVDQKRADAIALLQSLAAMPSSAPRPIGEARNTGFCMTEAWASDLDAAGLLWEAVGKP